MPFTNATVAITGGTGSFGNTMTRALLRDSVGEVRVLSCDEAKQEEMRQRLADSRVTFFPGDVRDRHSVDDVMAGVDLSSTPPLWAWR